LGPGNGVLLKHVWRSSSTPHTSNKWICIDVFLFCAVFISVFPTRLFDKLAISGTGFLTNLLFSSLQVERKDGFTRFLSPGNGLSVSWVGSSYRTYVDQGAIICQPIYAPYDTITMELNVSSGLSVHLKTMLVSQRCGRASFWSCAESCLSTK
jgi:hypothetical protein